ncbi:MULTISPECIES: hypothetical protein [Klebsiella]|uniref:hypothetical protein n=1 Tax=Klebsiella TaxID=570 RepID=UPI0010353552|nr:MULTISPECIES: hypothetical protein [Klebsiella]HCB1317855.1 hypothetical protein [Klebsiella variicola subsp. variicola]
MTFDQINARVEQLRLKLSLMYRTADIQMVAGDEGEESNDRETRFIEACASIHNQITLLQAEAAQMSQTN